MTPNAEKLRAQLVPEMLATDLADYLVRKVRNCDGKACAYCALFFQDMFCTRFIDTY